jgi:hypothetical protein
MLNPQIAIQKNISWIKRKKGDSPDETAFLSWYIYSLLYDAGFVDIRIKPFDWLHSATPLKLVDAVDKIGSILEKIPVIREFADSLHILRSSPQVVLKKLCAQYFREHSAPRNINIVYNIK